MPKKKLSKKQVKESLVTKSYNYLLVPPTTVNGLFQRIGTIVLVAMLLIITVRVIDGPNHRLGVINLQTTQST